MKKDETPKVVKPVVRPLAEVCAEMERIRGDLAALDQQHQDIINETAHARSAGRDTSAMDVRFNGLTLTRAADTRRLEILEKERWEAVKVDIAERYRRILTDLDAAIAAEKLALEALVAARQAVKDAELGHLRAGNAVSIIAGRRDTHARTCANENGYSGDTYAQLLREIEPELEAIKAEHKAERLGITVAEVLAQSKGIPQAPPPPRSSEHVNVEVGDESGAPPRGA